MSATRSAKIQTMIMQDKTTASKITEVKLAEQKLIDKVTINGKQTMTETIVITGTV